MDEREFLVAYDYGMGGLWAVLIAPSVGAIAAKYPELAVVGERPPWMDDERDEKLRSDPAARRAPAGILTAIVAERDK